MCVFALSWFSAEIFFRLQEAQHWLFFNRDLLPLLLLHLYKQIFFSYMEKLCCFCDIGSSFLRVPKMQQNFCDSDIWIGTKEFAQNAGNRISEVLDFKDPRTPLQMRDVMYASVSSGAGSAPDNRTLKPRNKNTHENCNYNTKEQCPLQNKRLVTNIVYKSHITTNDDPQGRDYIGLTEGTFKKTFYSTQEFFQQHRLQQQNITVKVCVESQERIKRIQNLLVKHWHSKGLTTTDPTNAVMPLWKASHLERTKRTPFEHTRRTYLQV
jgi:hypothetical protein